MFDPSTRERPPVPGEVPHAARRLAATLGVKVAVHLYRCGGARKGYDAIWELWLPGATRSSGTFVVRTGMVRLPGVWCRVRSGCEAVRLAAAVGKQRGPGRAV
jgi:hypothetical protein